MEIFFSNKSVRIASYVCKPVKTMEIRKTHVKNVQIDTSGLQLDDDERFIELARAIGRESDRSPQT